MNSVEESYYDSLKFVFDECHYYKQTIFETIRASSYPDFELDINSANLLFSLRQEPKVLSVYAVILNTKQKPKHNRVRKISIFSKYFPKNIAVYFPNAPSPYDYHNVSRIIPYSKKDEWNKEYTKMREGIFRAAKRLDRAALRFDRSIRYPRL